MQIKLLVVVVTGPDASRRGDVIRCTVMFGDEQERDGKVQVPVTFSVNGSRIVPDGDQAYIGYSPERPIYPYIAFRNQNSILAKVGISSPKSLMIAF